jgi:hypothetical protein
MRTLRDCGGSATLARTNPTATSAVKIAPVAIKPSRRPRVGWREWAALPDLGISVIKVKLDTGARSSSLHAYEIARHEDADGAWVEFAVHPLQRDRCTTVHARARLVEERWVRS